MFKEKKVKNIIINQKKNDKITKYYNTIETLKFEISEIWKSQNLIDVRTPSFLKVQLNLNNKNNLVELNKRLKKRHNFLIMQCVEVRFTRSQLNL